MLETTSLRETYLKAQHLAQGGDLVAATSTLEELLQIEPFLALVRNDAAALCFAQGQTDRAIQHLEQAVRDDPTHLTAHKNLAQLYQYKGDTPHAAEMVRRALALAPDDLECRQQAAALAAVPSPPQGPPPPMLAAHAAHFGRTMNLLLISQAVASIARARTGRNALRLAYVGTTPALDVSEALGDFGLQNAGCFAGNPADIFHPSRPIDELSRQDFDVVFIGDRDPARAQALAAAYARRAATWATTPGPMPIAVEIDALTAAHLAFLDEYQGSLDTCLNPHKLAIILTALVLTPRDGCVVEAGVAGGGTTVFMAKMQRILGINRPLYALDTFQGMPAPVDKDYGGGFVYTAGLFNETSVDRVRRNYQAHGVGDDIRIRPGLVQETLPQVVRESPRISLMLLDTDQYSGTKGGLDEGLPHLAPGGLIIVDDATIHGVNVAIDEAQARVPHLMRANLSVNFDLVWLESA